MAAYAEVGVMVAASLAPGHDVIACSVGPIVVTADVEGVEATVSTDQDAIAFSTQGQPLRGYQDFFAPSLGVAFHAQEITAQEDLGGWGLVYGMDDEDVFES